MFKVITNYCTKDKRPYKLGFYNKEEKWVEAMTFMNREKAFDTARALNNTEANARCMAEMARPIRKQFY